MKWYDSENNLFYTTDDQIEHPRSQGYEYWETYSYYDWVFIKGSDAADLPGQWTVELYIDGNKEVTEFFEIRSTTPTTTTTAPTSTTTSSPTQSPTPTPIIPEQEMTITTTPSSTHQEEEKQVEQSSFLSNQILIMLIVLSVIIIIAFIVISKRKKPMPTQTQQLPKKFCINCGAPALSGEIFCGSCGKSVE
jgi:hypothetical protein